MTMQQVTYPTVGSRMQAGDVIAFSGGSWFTKLISPNGVVSHAGLILDDGQQGITATFVESTVHFDPKVVQKPVFGVRDGLASKAVSDYDGTVWWLPLSTAARQQFNRQAFTDYVTKVKRRPFDFFGGAMAVVTQQLQARVKGVTLIPLPPLPFQDTAFFCSELVAGALNASGVVQMKDVSQAHPGDVTSWSIYENTYYLLKGNNTQIPHYNSLAPGSY